ncbi:hypothetical protein EXU30_00085 [Shewanella maritima]|uniref:Uncharacterized protein n=1 Tax=Shewanella maritima TaxID=2520507 RepID=A0A411PCG6_9GAMM|nr:hypothetical protein [Shewanella maritima]QBF81267.1 hypothetical protein EXU30_00085 [Shewanella maritima]
MLIKTYLTKGIPNSIAQGGKYFYLVTAADVVDIRFMKDSQSLTELHTEMREGMSNQFDKRVSGVTLQSESDQYVEFWISDTKLDYSKLAAGGAAANVNGGTVFCPAGKSLAVPSDFRRKAISIKVSDTCQIGGLDVSTFNGFTLEPNERIKAESRGDIWVYREPAKVTVTQGAAEKAAPPYDAFESTPSGLDFSIASMCQILNGALVAHRSFTPVYLDDDATWKPMTYKNESVHPQTTHNIAFFDDNALYVTNQNGRIYKSTDGKELAHLTTVKYGQDLDGNTINTYFGGDCYMQVFDSGQHIMYSNYDRVYVSRNGGASWWYTPVTPQKAFKDVKYTADQKALLASFYNSVYRLDLTNPSAEWEQVLDHGSSIIQDARHLAIAGNYIFKAYYSHSDSRYHVVASADNGLTWSEIDSGSSDKMKSCIGVMAFGSSIIFQGKNAIGVINDVTSSLNINWFESGLALADASADFASAMYYDPADETVNVFQAGAGSTPATTVISYPIAVTAGYLDGVTLSWLAEID